MQRQTTRARARNASLTQVPSDHPACYRCAPRRTTGAHLSSGYEMGGRALRCRCGPGSIGRPVPHAQRECSGSAPLKESWARLLLCRYLRCKHNFPLTPRMRLGCGM
jgi:hypothetical protein